MTGPATNPAPASNPPADPYKARAIGVGLLFTLTLPTLFVLTVVAQPAPPIPEPPRWSVEAAALGVAPADIAKGDVTFHAACAVCHGEDAKGIHLLGKPLRNSAYVQAETDEALLELLVEGRPVDHPLNTSGVLMPPRGAKGLDDEHLLQIVYYLRALQDPDAPIASTEAWNLKGGEGASLASIELTEHSGYDLFVASCAACHGQGADGMEGLGLPLSTSGFVRSQSDKDLITFIKMGRPIWDPNNTTGLDMPPKGGNPAISEVQLQTIVDYLRAIQDEAVGS